LIICSVSLYAVGEWLQVYFHKEPVELRKSLSLLDRDALGPYTVNDLGKLDKVFEDALGTTQYISWELVDTSVDERDPARKLYLFVAYYTGDTDKVSHVSEICQTANGGEVDQEENTEIIVPDCGLEDDDNKLPIRFMNVAFSGFKQTIAYYFSVNGDYRCTRNQVRWRMHSPWDRYAYFSKVEIRIPVGPDRLLREESLAAVEKLCRILTPLLWSEHWPDWESLEQR
ncbi:MAG: exosortase-associated EpsI family protein, partial [Planctomycetes bacterium]|nr:exosortase-associated EpsI family protein [Planctomycetota bacterium]